MKRFIGVLHFIVLAVLSINANILIKGVRINYLITVLLVLMITGGYSSVLTVKQDGSGQFSTIQSAITASVHSDTILVYPGTYFENINYSSKNITIASLELTSGNSAYRDSTIIDGNSNGSCVTLISHEDNATLFGFTIQHGSGTPMASYDATLRYGGGIWIRYATNFRITNCLIKDCRASDGGGIAMLNGAIYVKGLIIRDNYVSQAGGGIYIRGSSNIYFDSIDRCSVYENYAGCANDVFCGDTGSIIDVYLDIATVYPHTPYYIRYSKSTPTWFGNFGIVDILRGYRTEVNHDLYLAPDGNDANNGLSPATPKKTITKALHAIASDSLNANSIYLAPGTYSSENGQIFPIALKSFVRLVGDDQSPSLLINQRFEETINIYNAPYSAISNLTLEHGIYTPIAVLLIYKSDNTRLSNITINPVNAITYGGINIFHSKCDIDNIKLLGLNSMSNSGILYYQSNGSVRNCSIDDCHNYGTEFVSEYSMFEATYDSLLTIENLSITNCSVNTTWSNIIRLESVNTDNSLLRMYNVLIANNAPLYKAPVFISNNSDNTATISNCSFVNNSGGATATAIIGKAQVTNCIFFNLNTTEIYIGNTQSSGWVSQIDFSNNLIDVYSNSVYVHPSNQVTFNEFNFSSDPGFIGTDWTNPLSLRLNQNSSCIDAGTPDTTGLYIPQTDLYGNPRIYGGIIDIGCYEWDGVPNQDDSIPILDTNTLSIYPNPFKANTKISFILPEKGTTKLEIYNTKGQKVRTLLNGIRQKGYNNISWNGKDDNGKIVASGVYFAKICSGKIVQTCKIVVIK